MPLLEKDKEILLSQSGSKTSAEWEAFFDGKYPKKQLWDFCNTHNVKMKKMSKEDFSKLQSQRARKYNINQDTSKRGQEIWLICLDSGLRTDVFIVAECLILQSIRKINIF